jgi:hypothetical protein
MQRRRGADDATDRGGGGGRGHGAEHERPEARRQRGEAFRGGGTDDAGADIDVQIGERRRADDERSEQVGEFPVEQVARFRFEGEASQGAATPHRREVIAHGNVIQRYDPELQRLQSGAQGPPVAQHAVDQSPSDGVRRLLVVHVSAPKRQASQTGHGTDWRAGDAQGDPVEVDGEALESVVRTVPARRRRRGLDQALSSEFAQAIAVPRNVDGKRSEATDPP